MTRRIASLCLVTLGCLSLAQSANAQGATLSLSPAVSVASLGDVVTYSLNISGAGAATAWQTTVTIDTNFLAFVPNFGGTVPFVNSVPSFTALQNTLANGNATLALSFGNLTGTLGDNGTVTLGQFQIEVIAALGGAPSNERPVTLAPLGPVGSSVLDADSNELLSGVNGAVIQGQGGGAVTAPEPGTLALLTLPLIATGLKRRLCIK